MTRKSANTIPAEGVAVPAIVARLAAAEPVEAVWRNDVGGLTFRVGADRFVKWNPRSSGIDLSRERDRLCWLETRHPAPVVLDFGDDSDAQWMLTRAVPGSLAVGDPWRVRSADAIRAIADGLRAMHAIPTVDFPEEWKGESWANRTPESLGPRPPVSHAVLVHGDACAPNTIITPSGEWSGNVDMGDLTVGDRWADLAVASMSLDWNFGDGHQEGFFDAYGIAPDPERIAWYRALWDLES